MLIAATTTGARLGSVIQRCLMPPDRVEIAPTTTATHTSGIKPPVHSNATEGTGIGNHGRTTRAETNSGESWAEEKRQARTATQAAATRIGRSHQGGSNAIRALTELAPAMPTAPNEHHAAMPMQAAAQTAFIDARHATIRNPCPLGARLKPSSCSLFPFSSLFS
jgi:hypothetical protein